MLQVKPTRGRSSIGVRVAYGVNDSLVKANEIMSEVFSIYLSLEWDQKLLQCDYFHFRCRHNYYCI